MITGKPIALGGSAGRGDATARGGVYVTAGGGQDAGLDLQGQDHGHPGLRKRRPVRGPPRRTSILGLKLVAASDSKGGDLQPEGPRPRRRWWNTSSTTGSLQGFPGAEPISNEAILELDVTVLFPAALENVITPENASRLKCRISCELANGPTTPEADDILFDKGIFVLPDFLANAGGVTVSYFEQVQNTYNFYWPLREVHQRLDGRR